MIHVYGSCGVWELVVPSGWSFSVDAKIGGRLHGFQLSSSIEEFQKIVIEDFCLKVTDADLELSYLPIGLINSSECPPVIIANSSQVQNFLGFCKKHPSTQLCVTYKAKQDNEKKKGKMKQGQVDGDDYDADKHNKKKKGKMKQEEVDGDDDDDADKIISEKENRETLAKSSLLDLVKKGDVENSEVLPPETRMALGRKRKSRYETVEDKIRSSQGSQGSKTRKCSRCSGSGHNRATCKMPI
ncbi:Uncharacterized protein Rs2_29810 [Raphanus sativus]|nr:Uncharacterized protein Rs2_29810 [Raphanus sativus]